MPKMLLQILTIEWTSNGVVRVRHMFDIIIRITDTSFISKNVFEITGNLKALLLNMCFLFQTYSQNTYEVEEFLKIYNRQIDVSYNGQNILRASNLEYSY